MKKVTIAAGLVLVHALTSAQGCGRPLGYAASAGTTLLGVVVAAQGVSKFDNGNHSDNTSGLETSYVGTLLIVGGLLALGANALIGIARAATEDDTPQHQPVAPVVVVPVEIDGSVTAPTPELQRIATQVLTLARAGQCGAIPPLLEQAATLDANYTASLRLSLTLAVCRPVGN
jgi:hypothetical protein